MIRVGQIISVTPTKVRFDGDTSDHLIPLSLVGYTPTTGHRVLLVKVGSGWIILGQYA